VKIVMQPSLKEIENRLAIRGEDYLQKKHFEDVWNFYDSFLSDNPSWLCVKDNSPANAKRIVQLALGEK
jgi:hypothetical protein